MRKGQIWSLGLEDPLEKGMASHSSILAWRIPWSEESMGHKESDMTEQLTLNTAGVAELLRAEKNTFWN